VTFIPIARQRVGKHIFAETNARNSRTSIARQRSCNNASLTIEEDVFNEVRVFKTIGATRQLRIQLWSVNKRTTEAEDSPLL
jgi:hypothetical protein